MLKNTQASQSKKILDTPQKIRPKALTLPKSANEQALSSPEFQEFNVALDAELETREGAAWDETPEQRHISRHFFADSPAAAPVRAQEEIVVEDYFMPTSDLAGVLQIIEGNVWV